MVGAAGVEVVAHRRDRLALVVLAAHLLRVVLDRRDVVAVYAQVLAHVVRQRGQVVLRAHQDHRRAHRSRGEDQDLALDLLALAGRPRGVVAEDVRVHDVAIALGARALHRLHLAPRSHLHPRELGGRQVVRDHAVLGAEYAARVAPLGVHAAAEVDRERHPVAGVARSLQRRGPQAAGLRHLAPRGLGHAQAELRLAVVAVQRRARDLFRPYPAVRAVVWMVVAALEDLGRRP